MFIFSSPILNISLSKFEKKSEDKHIRQNINQDAIDSQLSRLKKFKKNRNTSQIKLALSKIEKDAKGKVNLLPNIINAVKNKCTLGEISDTLRKVFGEYI